MNTKIKENSVLAKVAQSITDLKKQTNTSESSVFPSTDNVMEDILEGVEYVNFDAIADREEGKHATPKQRAVICTDKLVEIAKELNRLIKIEGGKIFIFNGRYWQLLSTDETKNFMGKVAEKMGYEHCEARYHAEENKLFKQLNAAAYQKSTMTITDKVLINCPNRTLEIDPDDIISREHSAKDNLRYCLSFEYDPDATCPQFQKFLDEVLPDEESQRLLLEFWGYVFTKGMKLEKVLFNFGSGKNGKSVVYEIVRKFFGEENVSNYSLEEITNDKSYCRAGLQSKLLNYGSDINDKVNADAFKKMASDEPILARGIYERPEEIRNYAKQMYNTNQLPERGAEITDGFLRRMIVIFFKVIIPDENVDIHLPKKIYDTELSGILNLVIAGLQRILKQQSFSKCTASEELLAEFREGLNPIASFLNSGKYEASNDNDQYILLQDLYLCYKEHCKLNMTPSVSHLKFSSLLKTQGFRVEKIGQTGRRVFIKQNI
jgi:putative DNA primase/helicase